MSRFSGCLASVDGEIMLASRAYNWAISRSGDDDRLVLKNKTGKTYLLRRSVRP